jgi:hypothetical protein
MGTTIPYSIRKYHRIIVSMATTKYRYSLGTVVCQSTGHYRSHVSTTTILQLAIVRFHRPQHSMDIRRRYCYSAILGSTTTKALAIL